MAQNTEEKESNKRLLPLSVAALGVVYGDIGTSPLYAFRESFFGKIHLSTTAPNLLGVLSLIFWSLIIVITLKYLMVVMRADNRGEGGIIALVSLLNPQSARSHSFRGGLILLGLFGAALLYGDGTITPAISVLSAIEGLKVATTTFEPVIIPLTIIILIGLFMVQRHGTYAIGSIFGPIMILWFTTLGVLGMHGILQEPKVLAALNPQYAISFVLYHGIIGIFVLGAVFLAVTGGETLYADMGHFGRGPIRFAWFTLVLPALVLNYFGQGALILREHTHITHPFYDLAPDWALYPLVLLATVATVIASQAVISGVFSLSRQAIQLGQLPRMRIIQTHGEEFGQIYIPVLNWGLMIATIALVMGFRTSSNLASAYGVAISTDMVITTILTLYLAYHWGWHWLLVAVMGVVFLIVDLAFFGANLLKIFDGGWYPLLIGAFVFTIMTTWRKGRRLLAAKLVAEQLPIQKLVRMLEDEPITRTPGTAVFMTSGGAATPPILLHHLEHNQALQKRVVLFNVDMKEVPHVPANERLEIKGLAPGVYWVRARYGFMQAVNVPLALRLCEKFGLEIDLETTTYYLGRETLIASDDQVGMVSWRDHLFQFLSRNAYRATAFYHIPLEQVVEIGIQVEI